MNFAWELEFEQLMKTVMDSQDESADLSGLDDLLAKSPEAMDAYIAMIKVDAMLRWRGTRGQREDQEEPNIDVISTTREEPKENWDSKASPISSAMAQTPLLESAIQPPPTAFFPENAVHGTLGYLSSGWLVSYLLAMMIMGIGLAVMAFVQVSPPILIATRPESVLEQPQAVAQRAESVGRITGMANCKWADPHTDLAQNANVTLGRKYALASGLLEITYDTGAKVLLQGPVKYEVESTNGGFMAIGKLTGKVESSKAKGFAIRTPTAVVTDLGTEFGVEVDDRGNTVSHVFRGLVSLHPRNAGKETKADDTVLRVNESARVEWTANGQRQVAVRRVRIKPDVFVKSLKESSPVQVLAWFRMGEDEPGAIAGKAVGKQVSDHRNYVHLERIGSPKYSDDTAAPGSSLAMSFGGSDEDCVGIARFPYVLTDYFIIEAWVKIRKIGDHNQCVVHNGHGGLNGYALAAINGTWQSVYEGGPICDSGVACEFGKWTHLALVCERGRSQLWVNGQARGRAIDAIPSVPDGPFAIGGSYRHTDRAFYGEIDEVRLSTFIGPFQPSMLLLGNGNKSGNNDGK